MIKINNNIIYDNWLWIGTYIKADINIWGNWLWKHKESRFQKSILL